MAKRRSDEVRVTVRPNILRWARERAALEPAELAKKVGLSLSRVEAWEESGELSLSHLQRLANKTYTPVGYFFLEAPPEDRLPIADFRSVAGEATQTPSPELLDTLTQCQQRQQWFIEYARSEGDEPLAFVGSATIEHEPDAVAADIREQLDLTTERRIAARTWQEALTSMYTAAEAAGILVMRNGVVGNNTHRKLDVNEFRGFALSDKYAPLIFVNAADAKSAQMFTLAHELCHIWLGASAVTDASPTSTVPIERFCNKVAAEVLVPRPVFVQAWRGGDPVEEKLPRLTRAFKVSSLVVLIRAREAGLLTQSAFEQFYTTEQQAHRDGGSSDGGGDFYKTQRSRLGRRFARAVIASALEGRTPYKEAFELLGVKKASTFDELARQLGVLL